MILRAGRARASGLDQGQGKQMDCRNLTTGEIAPGHRNGTDDEGRVIYQRVAGWEPTVAYDCDEDGNWFEVDDQMPAPEISYANNPMGTIKHDGLVVDLIEQAEPTSRLLPDPLRADRYVEEWSARGKTTDGLNARVYWLHLDDGETLPEDYDWSDVDRVEIVD